MVSRVIPSSQERLHRKGSGIKSSKPKEEQKQKQARKPQKQA
jgi:hypothetical protein